MLICHSYLTIDLFIYLIRLIQSLVGHAGIGGWILNKSIVSTIYKTPKQNLKSERKHNEIKINCGNKRR